MAIMTEPKTEVNISFNKVSDSHYQALSSDGETWYDLTVNPNSEISCNCPARVECKHIRNLRLLLAAEGWQAFAARVNGKAIAAGVVPSVRVEAEHQQAEAARNRLADDAIIPGPKPMTVAEIKAMAASIPDELMWG